jgi:NAD-dependent dihydropyrimidine dehydrogenase PreA subunit
MTQATRKIVHIDEEKCDGCGQCVPNCAEGAIRIVNGKARLLAEKLCDGLGACLGTCPRGAITIEERPADDFDHQAVERHLKSERPEPCACGHDPAPLPPPAPHHHHGAGGCPGSRARTMPTPAPAANADRAQISSQLRHWPVQLALVPPTGPMWENAHILIAADCVPFAYPQFHDKLLAGKSLAIACPKLDDVEPYVRKLAMIFSANRIQSITVAHMEVPCCGGIVRVVKQAMAMAGRDDIPLRDITIGIDGSSHEADGNG